MIAKCLKCGKEYELGSDEKLSDFQCECGGELSSNKIASEPVKKTKPKKKPNFKEDWDKQSTNRKVGIGIAGVCCIGVILIVVFGGVLSPNKTTMNSKTYSGQGLTFNYPDSWTINGQDITTPNSVGGDVSNLGSLKEYASESPAIPATLDAVAADIRSDTGPATKQTISIGGVNGIEYIPVGDNSGGNQRVDIVFAKGDTLYSIWINTQNYDADKDGVNMIINTMKIQ